MDLSAARALNPPQRSRAAYTRASAGHALEESSFLWLAGIEDTFITAPSARTGRSLDEYELTGHYERWREDLELFAELGVPMVRYGVPWHRINPARGRWDFGWADGPLERLLELGIQPVVDLVHYGLPGWMADAYLESDFPALMSDYAARVADRYRGRIHAYTPLNEPRVTAWYCGKLGWWPPYRRGWRGFVSLMLALCRGMAETARALRAVDEDILLVHVDATDLYTAAAPELEPEAQRRQELVFLALDLVTGRVRPGHPLYSWLLAHGADASQLAWFADHVTEPDWIGINLYPMFSQKLLLRTPSGLRTRMRYAGGEIVAMLSELYWRRYRKPLLVSETASVGSVAKRMAWLEASVSATRAVRARGIPLIGYCWWPLFALVTWGYREGRKPPQDYLRQMGLWDLRPGDGGLERVRTQLADRFRELAAGGASAVGPLRSTHACGSPTLVS